MKRRNIFLVLILFALSLSSCKYDFILPEVVPPVTETVSFADQVLPIFSNGNKCTACHNGSQAPDLRAANAYAQIVPALITTATPESSIIYSTPAPSTSTHSWKKYTAGEAAIILAWIKDGTKNN